jgi:hypothetical protein
MLYTLNLAPIILKKEICNSYMIHNDRTSEYESTHLNINYKWWKYKNKDKYILPNIFNIVASIQRDVYSSVSFSIFRTTYLIYVSTAMNIALCSS